MQKDQQNIDPKKVEKAIRIAIAILSALLGFFSANATNALFIH